MRNLCVIDFDDTLVKTDAKIGIKNKGLWLSSYEFSQYTPEEGDIFDFTEFRADILINPQPTRFFLTTFKRIIDEDTDIIILTARPHLEEIKDFLVNFVPLKRLKIIGGADTPKKKKEEIEKVLEDYDEIKFYDDSILNIEAVEEIRSPKILTQIVKK